MLQGNPTHLADPLTGGCVRGVLLPRVVWLTAYGTFTLLSLPVCDCLVCCCCCLCPWLPHHPIFAAPYSGWGCSGELWDPTARLPADWGFAGYMNGDVPLPDVPVVGNVRDFGARGDNVSDDTAAFAAAFAAASVSVCVWGGGGREGQATGVGGGGGRGGE